MNRRLEACQARANIYINMFIVVNRASRGQTLTSPRREVLGLVARGQEVEGQVAGHDLVAVRLTGDENHSGNPTHPPDKWSAGAERSWADTGTTARMEGGTDGDDRVSGVRVRIHLWPLTNNVPKEASLQEAPFVSYDWRSSPPEKSCLYSSVAQWQSIRLLTGGLLVRVQPEEPIVSITYRHIRLRPSQTVPKTVPTLWH